jgi:hypothetical protein
MNTDYRESRCTRELVDTRFESRRGYLRADSKLLQFLTL